MNKKKKLVYDILSLAISGEGCYTSSIAICDTLEEELVKLIEEGGDISPESVKNMTAAILMSDTIAHLSTEMETYYQRLLKFIDHEYGGEIINTVSNLYKKTGKVLKGHKNVTEAMQAIKEISDEIKKIDDKIDEDQTKEDLPDTNIFSNKGKLN